MAHVSHRANANGTVSWRVRYRVNGKPTTSSFTDAKAAKEYADLVDTVGGKTARDILASRRSNHARVPTLREWTETYLDPESGIVTGITDGTRAGYRAIAERGFLPTLGQHPLNAIDKLAVGKWVAWLEKQWGVTLFVDGRYQEGTAGNHVYESQGVHR